MKFAFDVKGKPELFRALQEKAVELGKYWPSSPFVLGMLLRELRDEEYFYFDTEHHFFGFPERLPQYIPEAGADVERQRRLYRSFLQRNGYKLDAFDEFFALERSTQATDYADSSDTTATQEDGACGVLTHVSDCELWYQIHKKLETLGLECTGRMSVPCDATIIDLNGRKFRDCWIDHKHINATNIVSFDEIRWINVADLLAWERMLTEKEALSAFGELWQSGNDESFLNLLSCDFRYSSQWVLNEMRSKYAFRNYIRGKLSSLRESNSSVKGELGVWGDRPCLTLRQETGRKRQATTAFATVIGGMITSISIGSVPGPEDIDFSGNG